MVVSAIHGTAEKKGRNGGGEGGNRGKRGEEEGGRPKAGAGVANMHQNGCQDARLSPESCAGAGTLTCSATNYGSKGPNGLSLRILALLCTFPLGPESAFRSADACDRKQR